MLGLLALAFIVVPILELAVFARVAGSFGFGNTLALVVLVSIVGAWLVKREGMSAWRRANERMARGEVPANELLNGLLILVAGAFMLTPGFLTDAVGLACVLAPTRTLLNRALRSRITSSPGLGGSFITFSGPLRPRGEPRGREREPIEVEVLEVERTDDP